MATLLQSVWQLAMSEFDESGNQREVESPQAGEECKSAFVKHPDESVSLGVLLKDGQSEEGLDSSSPATAASTFMIVESLIRLRDSLAAAELLHGLVASQVLDTMRTNFNARSKGSAQRCGALMLVDWGYWLVQWLLLGLVTMRATGSASGFLLRAVEGYAALGTAVLCGLGIMALHRRSIGLLNLYLVLAVVSTILLVRATATGWLFLVVRSGVVLAASYVRVSYHKARAREAVFHRAKKANAAAVGELGRLAEGVLDVALAVDACEARRAAAHNTAAALVTEGGPAAVDAQAALLVAERAASQSRSRMQAGVDDLRARLGAFRPVDYAPFMANTISSSQMSMQGGPGRPGGAVAPGSAVGSWPVMGLRGHGGRGIRVVASDAPAMPAPYYAERAVIPRPSGQWPIDSSNDFAAMNPYRSVAVGALPVGGPAPPAYPPHAAPAAAAPPPGAYGATFPNGDTGQPPLRFEVTGYTDMGRAWQEFYNQRGPLAMGGPVFTTAESQQQHLSIAVTPASTGDGTRIGGTGAAVAQSPVAYAAPYDAYGSTPGRDAHYVVPAFTPQAPRSPGGAA